MSDIAIRVENLGKQYHIGALQKAGGRHTYKSLRDSIADAASLPLRAGRRLVGQGEPASNGHDETFWALKDVSFDIKHGEIVGVIGRNGAGKSTLLKLLSRITEPTTGRVEIHGRVGSLLEVGTGFHPELSGRDNVYMNGAILGMKRAEIARQFDEIVAFAEVEKFIDTPVKHYSSGMYLRLAFAVAAHLQTEILIVDEVLAVGDLQFQKKCVGKMQDVGRSGRTVVFVSHNLPAVQQLCSESIWINGGEIASIGSTSATVQEYLRRQSTLVATWARPPQPYRANNADILELSTTNSRGEFHSEFQADEGLRIYIRLITGRNFENLQVAVRLSNQNGIPVLSTCNTDSTRSFKTIGPGLHEYLVSIPPSLLAPGSYSIIAATLQPQIGVIDLVEDKLTFRINDIGSLGALFRDGRLGTVEPVLEWDHLNCKEQA